MLGKRGVNGFVPEAGRIAWAVRIGGMCGQRRAGLPCLRTRVASFFSSAELRPLRADRRPQLRLVRAGIHGRARDRAVAHGLRGEQDVASAGEDVAPEPVAQVWGPTFSSIPARSACWASRRATLRVESRPPRSLSNIGPDRRSPMYSTSTATTSRGRKATSSPPPFIERRTSRSPWKSSTSSATALPTRRPARSSTRTSSPVARVRGRSAALQRLEEPPGVVLGNRARARPEARVSAARGGRRWRG